MSAIRVPLPAANDDGPGPAPDGARVLRVESEAERLAEELAASYCRWAEARAAGAFSRGLLAGAFCVALPAGLMLWLCP